MGSTLNPNLLAKDTTAVLNRAAGLVTRYRKKNLFPEIALMALLEQKDSPGYHLLQQFAEAKGTDLARLERQVRLAVESRRDLPGDLSFITQDNKSVELSRQMIIALDEALTIAQNNDEVWIGTDHLLAAMSKKTLGTGGILRQHGITPGAIADITGGGVQDRPGSKAHPPGTVVDYVTLAKNGSSPPIYMRKTLLR